MRYRKTAKDIEALQQEIYSEANRIRSNAPFLTAFATTTTTKVARHIVLSGLVMVGGYGYRPKIKSVGAGCYEVMFTRI